MTTLMRSSHLAAGFALRCFQRLSIQTQIPSGAPGGTLVNRRSVQHGPLVLVSAPRKTPTPTIDRDRTVSRRSEPSSRATLMGEQPNPWDLLQPQDVTSRHRGANHSVDMSSWEGSACYPRSTFILERWPFHTEPPDHYALLSHLIDL